MNTPIFRAVRSGMLSLGTASRIEGKIDDPTSGVSESRYHWSSRLLRRSLRHLFRRGVTPITTTRRRRSPAKPKQLRDVAS
jgi:hypothetical protein